MARVRAGRATGRALVAAAAGKHASGLITPRRVNHANVAKYRDCVSFDRDDSLSTRIALDASQYASTADGRPLAFQERDRVTGKLVQVQTLLLTGRIDRTVKVSRERSKGEQARGAKPRQFEPEC